jgi:hypothetical protein
MLLLLQPNKALEQLREAVRSSCRLQVQDSPGVL